MVSIAVTGSGRCGTHSVANFLSQRGLLVDGSRPIVKHESNPEKLIKLLLLGDQDAVLDLVLRWNHEIEVSPYLVFLDNLPRSFRAIAVMRDGRDTIRAGLRDGWYYESEKDHWSDLQPRVSSDRFENACHFWNWTYRKLLVWDAPIFRLEDLRTSDKVLQQLLVESSLISNGTQLELPHRNKDRIGKIKFKVLKQIDPGPFSTWTEQQKQVFEERCGELMDQFYDGWRDDDRAH
jgi:hypothetical protein